MNPFALVLAALLWLPGHLAFELGVPRDSRIRRWPTAEIFFAKVSASAVYLLWLSLVLVQAGFFSALTLTVAALWPLLAVGALALLRGRRLAPEFRFVPDASLVVVLALVIIGTLLYSPEFELVIGARDPVTYTLTGIRMAREGGWVDYDELVPQIPEVARRDLLGPDYSASHAHYTSRFLGFYLLDPDTGAVVPQGLPVYPSAIALGYLGGELPGALAVTPLLAILGAIGVFYCGRRLFSPVVGATAAFWLLLSPPQIWFSRYANAEIMAQFLIFVGLYGLVAYRREGAPFYGLMGAIALGLCWQTHVWMVWLGFPLLGLLVFDLSRGQTTRTDALVCWGPLFFLGLHALAQYFLWSWAYIWDLTLVVRDTLWMLAPAGAAVAALLLVAWSRGRRKPIAEDKQTGSAATARWPRGLAAILLVTLAVYGYWIRPVLVETWAALSVERLVLGMVPAAFWLATLGVVLLVLDRQRDEATFVFLAVFLGVSIPILFEPNIRPMLMWTLRRFLPLIYPGIFLLAAVATWWPFELVRRRSGAGGLDSGAGSLQGAVGAKWLRATAVAGCVAVSLLMAAALASRGLGYRGFKQPGEAAALLDEIADSVEPDSVLIFEARSDWRLLDLAPGLDYLKGFDVLWLHAKRVDPANVREFVWQQARQGRSVYFFTQGFNYYIPEPKMVPHHRWSFWLQEMEEVLGRRPTTVHANPIRFASYRMEPGGFNGPVESPLDIGAFDDIYVGEMLPPEYDALRSFRWTKGTSYVWLPGLDAETTQFLVDMRTFSDPSKPRTLRVSLDGVELGEAVVTGGWRTYRFDVPAEWQPSGSSAPRLELSIEPMRPADVVGGDDQRYLGVSINTISWR